MTSVKAKEIDLGNDFGAATLKINGMRLEIGADGKKLNVVSATSIDISATANTNAPQASTAIASAKNALEIGERMKDGTVVITVDLEKNIALFAPAGIFGADAPFEQQNIIVTKANSQGLHGYSDWRRITDKEGSALAKNWDKVAPPVLLQNSRDIGFWGESQSYQRGRVYTPGKIGWAVEATWNKRPVPLVRSGRAWD